ncbi:hypothetical protein F5878DRAFT_647143 [Lentinula raphanica]|uniref:Uncharacterized protein n=1 Tax=Lentinula raphanica TaxID=153919 RepID=A0AA38UAM0_9AGAR|nr:hypothetical protein F5878DRAFT_647143 [Lentinula raphanica]
MAVDGGLMGHGGVKQCKTRSEGLRAIKIRRKKSNRSRKERTKTGGPIWSYGVSQGNFRTPTCLHLSFLELHKRSEKRLFFPIPSKKKTSLLAKEVSKVPRQVLNFQVHITIINVSLAPALQKKTLLFVYLLYISNYKPQSISICIALKMRFDIIRLALSASLVFVVSAVPVPPDDGYTPLGHRYSNSNTGGGKQTTVDGVGVCVVFANTFFCPYRTRVYHELISSSIQSTGRTTVTSHFEPAGTSGQRNGPSQSWNTNTGTSHSYSNHNPGNYYIDLSIPISIQMRNVNTGIGSQNNFQGTGNQDNVFNRVPEDMGSSSHNANSRIDLSIPISIQTSNVNFGSGPQNNFQGTGTSRTYINGVLFYMWLAQLWEGWLKLYLFSAWSGREQGWCNFPQQSRGEECFWMDRYPNVILT